MPDTFNYVASQNCILFLNALLYLNLLDKCRENCLTILLLAKWRILNKQQAHTYDMTWEIFAAFSALRAQDSHLRSDITNLGRHPSQQFIGKFVYHGQPLQIRHTRPLYNHYLWLFMKEFFFKEQTQPFFLQLSLFSKDTQFINSFFSRILLNVGIVYCHFSMVQNVC